MLIFFSFEDSVTAYLKAEHQREAAREIIHLLFHSPNILNNCSCARMKLGAWTPLRPPTQPLGPSSAAFLMHWLEASSEVEQLGIITRLWYGMLATASSGLACHRTVSAPSMIFTIFLRAGEHWYTASRESGYEWNSWDWGVRKVDIEWWDQW